ncbi:tyrosine-specific transport system [Capsicum galapagoense]
MLVLNQFRIQFFRQHSCYNKYITHGKSLKVPSFKQVVCKPTLDGFKGRNLWVKHKALAVSLNVDEVSVPESYNVEEKIDVVQEKSFRGAVGLIVGTAVGPGMLGLPAATVKSGPLPSTISLLLTWVYVISSIILVAELSFAAMEEDGVDEVSFTSLATKALGSKLGSFVALLYGSLAFALLVACVSGIGLIISQWFPKINPVLANGLFPSLVGIVLCLLPFKAIDVANRCLCITMLFSITALVVTGISVGRMSILDSFGFASWRFSSVLPAIPVAVLTMGFHVITPFICKLAGNTVHDARKAIVIGGTIPLVMVVSWNLIVLGLSGHNASPVSSDPISLLLSVNSSVLPAVQGFAFSALATSLIGYAVSFPKQVIDTLDLIFTSSSPPTRVTARGEVGKVGSATFNLRQNLGNAGKICYSGIKNDNASEVRLESGFNSLQSIVMPLVLALPVFIGSFFPSTFSRALDFAGIYANCFLFGILPPVMTYIYQSRKKLRFGILPGGDGVLLLLLAIAVMLFIWH